MKAICALTLSIILGPCIALLFGCASPEKRSDELATGSGFSRTIVTGAPFRHVVYRNALQSPRSDLHVYIEGDGSPFEWHTVIAADPTSRSPLMLLLMSEDSAPSVYLGRPCYLGLHREAGCTSDEWTSRRFSPEVLNSMEAALRSEIARSGASHVELYGHSGGGTLAVLLAQRVNEVTRVITLAPTLDIDAWCRLHHYTLLEGSVNPVDLPEDRASLEVVHWVGDQDKNTPPALIQAAARSRDESVQVVAGFDHDCCWRKIWRGILTHGAETER